MTLSPPPRSSARWSRRWRSPWLAFRIERAPDLRLAILLTATILAAPHSGPYDAVLLVVAAALWLADRTAPPAPLAWLVATAIWVVPLLSPAVYVRPDGSHRSRSW